MAFQTVLSGASQDVFQPIAGSIPSYVPTRTDHPVPRTGIVNQTLPIPTNKFYANFFLGGQNQPSWTHPYSVSWCKGAGNAQSFGLAVSHTDADQRVLGDSRADIPGSPSRFFFSPVGIQSMILSASEMGGATVLTTDTLKCFSTNVNLQASPGSYSRITFPIVQGMGFLTGRYTNLQPTIQSSVFFRNFDQVPSPKPGVVKFRITLEDSKCWLVYVTPENGSPPNIQRVSNTLYRGSPGFSGIIQVAKNSFMGPGESMYDAVAGVYSVDAHVTGSVAGRRGQYSLNWSKRGRANTPLLMFALPHLIQSFDDTTKHYQTGFQLATTTKGYATAVVADRWTMVETSLPCEMGFAPWSPTGGASSTLSASARATIQNIASNEVTQNMDALINTDSMYFSGKIASKFATLVYTIHDLLQDTDLAAAALTRLKNAVARFIDNKQAFPLVYESSWKGVVSSGTYQTGQPLIDFGNTFYNDHQFHYGYWIHAAAIIGHLDPSWAVAHRDWVNMLVKDTCNPVTDGRFFPFSRSFDWYHGHSWAHGLFEFADGKDLESTSEDSLFAYGIKMWGKVISDKSMEARGNLMLAIQARSFQNYFLMDSSNTNQPASFIGNKVSGILFENKCDHATWFDPHLYTIQGIHMIPLVPSSALIRTQKFVKEEWDAYFRAGGPEPAENVSNGWKGILYSNFAIINPNASWDFFAQPGFDPNWLDNGASRTWCLAYAAGLGGGPY